jgi:hypothetical protein
VYLRIHATKTPVLQHGYTKEQRGVAGKLEISLDFFGQVSVEFFLHQLSPKVAFLHN